MLNGPIYDAAKGEGCGHRWCPICSVDAWQRPTPPSKPPIEMTRTELAADARKFASELRDYAHACEAHDRWVATGLRVQ